MPTTSSSHSNEDLTAILLLTQPPRDLTASAIRTRYRVEAHSPSQWRSSSHVVQLQLAISKAPANAPSLPKSAKLLGVVLHYQLSTSAHTWYDFNPSLPSSGSEIETGYEHACFLVIVHFFSFLFSSQCLTFTCRTGSRIGSLAGMRKEKKRKTQSSDPP